MTLRPRKLDLIVLQVIQINSVMIQIATTTPAAPNQIRMIIFVTRLGTNSFSVPINKETAGGGNSFNNAVIQTNVRLNEK